MCVTYMCTNATVFTVSNSLNILQLFHLLHQVFSEHHVCDIQLMCEVISYPEWILHTHVSLSTGSLGNLTYITESWSLLVKSRIVVKWISEIRYWLKWIIHIF